MLVGGELSYATPSSSVAPNLRFTDAGNNCDSAMKGTRITLVLRGTRLKLNVIAGRQCAR